MGIPLGNFGGSNAVKLSASLPVLCADRRPAIPPMAFSRKPWPLWGIPHPRPSAELFSGREQECEFLVLQPFPVTFAGTVRVFKSVLMLLSHAQAAWIHRCRTGRGLGCGWIFRAHLEIPSHKALLRVGNAKINFSAELSVGSRIVEDKFHRIAFGIRLATRQLCAFVLPVQHDVGLADG